MCPKYFIQCNLFGILKYKYKSKNIIQGRIVGLETVERTSVDVYLCLD